MTQQNMHTTPIRLDRFLRQYYPNLTQGIIQMAIRQGLIKINDSKAKEASLRLKQYDMVSSPLYFEQYIPQKQHYFNDSVVSLSQKILDKYIIFENQDFLAINKPEKIATQGGSRVKISLDDALKYLNTQGGNFKLVHRLDKDTSGLMLIAKHYDAAVKLTGAFRDKQISKTYLALTSGRPELDSGVVSIDNEITKYNVLKYQANKNIAYMEFSPITGKEHQIRRHSLKLGCPIIGDKKYANLRDQGHMLLHSYKATISDSVFGIEYNLLALLPDYFKSALQKL
jgi:23S rRNA pseudouridine955/2504/2580 synthase